MRIVKHIPTWIRTMLSAKHGATLRHDTEIEILGFGSPSEVYPGLFTDQNTAIRCRIGDYITGTVYNRVNLATYWATIYQPANVGRGLIIKSNVVTCTHDILNDINRYTGLDLAPEEVINHPIADGTYTTVMLTVTDKCMWFTGGVDITLDTPLVVSDGKQITLLDLDLRIARLSVPFDGVRVSPAILTYDTNYTDDMMLGSIATTVDGLLAAADAVAIAAMLKRNDGLPWTHVYTTTTPASLKPYNLYGYSLAFNGPVEDYKLFLPTWATAQKFNSEGVLSRLTQLPREDQMFVMVLVPPITAWNSNLTSEPIFIHYGGLRKKTAYKPPVHYWPLQGTRDNFGTHPQRPPCAMQGSMLQRDNAEGVISLKTLTQGSTVVGADLPIDRDFTLRFVGYARAINASRGYFKKHDSTAFLCRVGQETMDLTGSWDVSRRNHYESATQGYQHTEYALVRRGDWWLIYINGEVARVYRGGNRPVSSINMFYAYTADEGIIIRDLAYYNYGMTGDQLRSVYSQLPALVGSVDSDPVEPLHYWPLQGTFENLGSSKKVLAPICGFRDVNIEGITGKWAYRNKPTATELGVPLQVDRDFTLSFDIHNSVSGTTYSVMFMTGSNSVLQSCLWFYNFAPYIYNAVGDMANVAPKSGACNRIQIVRRGDVVMFYINGRPWASQLWLDKTVSEWTHFGVLAGYYFSDYHSFKNLRYYDQALTEHQLKNEDGVAYI